MWSMPSSSKISLSCRLCARTSRAVSKSRGQEVRTSRAIAESRGMCVRCVFVCARCFHPNGLLCLLLLLGRPTACERDQRKKHRRTQGRLHNKIGTHCLVPRHLRRFINHGKPSECMLGFSPGWHAQRQAKPPGGQPGASTHPPTHIYGSCYAVDTGTSSPTSDTCVTLVVTSTHNHVRYPVGSGRVQEAFGEHKSAL